MMKLKKIDVLSAGKISGMISLIVGLILGIFSAVFGGIALSLMGFAAGVGMWAIIIFPIVYGLIGFIAGIIGAALFNLVAKWKFIDGLEIEIQE